MLKALEMVGPAVPHRLPAWGESTAASNLPDIDDLPVAASTASTTTLLSCKYTVALKWSSPLWPTELAESSSAVTCTVPEVDDEVVAVVAVDKEDEDEDQEAGVCRRGVDRGEDHVVAKSSSFAWAEKLGSSSE